jgi:CDP-diglyceride synthetase
MFKVLLTMYITLIPPIISGILNMIWCKMPILKKLQVPMDFGKNFIDKKRIFGDNKSWKGFLGYLILNILTAIIWGMLCNKLGINKYNYFYINYENTFVYNLLIGFSFSGLEYFTFNIDWIES